MRFCSINFISNGSPFLYATLLISAWKRMHTINNNNNNNNNINNNNDDDDDDDDDDNNNNDNNNAHNQAIIGTI